MADFASKLRQLKALSAWQWSVLLRSPFIYPFVYVRLRQGGFKQALLWVHPDAAKSSGLPPGEELQLARETSYALSVGLKYGVWKPNCVTRSVALAWFLSRKAISCDIRIGVPGALNADNAADFTAHAWVETQGMVLNDSQQISQKFQPFDGVESE